MSEEIKEILDKLKDSNWYDELDLTGTRWIELTWKETHLLLDYITNLPQKVEQLEKEIERLNNIIDNARKYIENNQSGCENENGHFHLNFDGDIWELYEMLRRF